MSAGLSRPVERVELTAEWRAEQEAKQREYQRTRRQWREEVDIVRTY